MHEFEVPPVGVSLDAFFVRVEAPQGLFATNIRIYKPGSNSVGNPDDQEAWSGNGTMTFHFSNPEVGTWTVRLLHCDLPQGQHVIDSRVTVTR